MRKFQSLQARLVDALWVDETVAEGLNAVYVIDIFVNLLQLRQSGSVEHAEEADEHALEVLDDFDISPGMAAESNQSTTGIEPLGPHRMSCCTSVPKPIVGLRCAKDDEETDQETEATPRLGLS